MRISTCFFSGLFIFSIFSGFMIYTDVQKIIQSDQKKVKSVPAIQNKTISEPTPEKEKLMIGMGVKYFDTYNYSMNTPLERHLQVRANIVLKKGSNSGPPCNDASVFVEINNHSYKIPFNYPGVYNADLGKTINPNSMIRVLVTYPSIIPGYPPHKVEAYQQLEKLLSLSKFDERGIQIDKNGLMVTWEPSVPETTLFLIHIPKKIGVPRNNDIVFYSINGNQYLIPKKHLIDGETYMLRLHCDLRFKYEGPAASASYAGLIQSVGSKPFTVPATVNSLQK